MSDIENLARLFTSFDPASDGVSKDELIVRFLDLRDFLQGKFGDPIPPLPGESVGVGLLSSKTTALFFDRVWSTPGMYDHPPEGVMVYGATPFEYFPNVVAAAKAFPEENYRKFIEVVMTHPEYGRHFGADAVLEKSISDSLYLLRNWSAIPIYESEKRRNDQYVAGNTESIIFAIQNINVVKEESLSWEQVLEFRKDGDSRRNLRRLRHWLDSEMDGRSIAYVSDEIEERVEKYERALKKHGILTVTGCLSDLFDLKSVSAASIAGGVGVAISPAMAALASGLVLGGRIAVSATTRFLELADAKNGAGSEVAFVSEIKKLSQS